MPTKEENYLKHANLIPKGITCDAAKVLKKGIRSCCGLPFNNDARETSLDYGECGCERPLKAAVVRCLSCDTTTSGQHACESCKYIMCMFCNVKGDGVFLCKGCDHKQKKR
jgi:hypothetical protein